jgi:hypothetical protein
MLIIYTGMMKGRNRSFETIVLTLEIIIEPFETIIKTVKIIIDPSQIIMKL